MLRRRAKAYSSSGSVVLLKIWLFTQKLIYKYQILYLDRITIVQWRHLANDIDLCRSQKSPKNHKTSMQRCVSRPQSEMRPKGSKMKAAGR